MLRKYESGGNDAFEMNVAYARTIDISFKDVFVFLEESKADKKILFIDPIVLSNQDILLDIERKNINITLVPTNIHEASKEMESVLAILKVFEEQGVGRRNDMICAIGGGALMDAVSFAASIYRRGISIVKVPTTLLGIVDAAIGIKTGVNFESQRNRIGSYHFDFQVIIDPRFLEGINKGMIRQGLGEIFKIATIKGESLFNDLHRFSDRLEDINFYKKPDGIKIINKSIELMLEELHDNPREDNLKRCVDFGHSFGPMAEMVSLKRLGSRTLPHGYAVAFDCVLTTAISLGRDLITGQDYHSIISLYKKFDFDFYNEIYNEKNLLWASFLDLTKHRGGVQNLPVPTGIGKFTFLQDVTFDEMSIAIDVVKASLIK